MSRADIRGGRAPIRSAAELAVLLPIPILMIVEGWAQPLFPNSTPAHPSPYVVVALKRPKQTYPRYTGLPVYIHWTQWEGIVAPILQDLTTFRWRGTVGTLADLLRLQNNVVGPDGSVVFNIDFEVGFSGFTEESVGALYGCDQRDIHRVTGRVAEYLAAMGSTLMREAEAAGY